MTAAVRSGAKVDRALAALSSEVLSLSGRDQTVEVGFEGARGVVKDDEILVVVFGAHGGVVSRSTVRGRPVSWRELRLRLAGAEVAVERLAAQPELGSPPLSPAEASVLDKLGFVERERGMPGALEKSQIEYDMLLGNSFTLEQAAKMLGLKNPSRLRQRLGLRTLYGVKEGGAWRLPRFQFDVKQKKVVRGIEQVFPRIRPDAHALEVATWFSLPHQDLVVGDDDERVTPLAWLASGRSPETVANLADEV